MRKWLQLDWMLLGTILFLIGVSVLVLYSLSPDAASGGYAMKQLVFSLVGVGILGVFSSFDYRHIQKYSTALYFGMLFVLLAVLLWGNTVNGTEGWIQFWFIRFQPVEATKLVLIIFLASFISKKRTELGDLVRLAVSFVLTSALILLVLKQPDLGSALVLAGIWLGMTLVAGVQFRHFVLLAVGGMLVLTSSWFFLAPYQKNRIMTFIEPQLDPQGSGYNVIQATVAVGSGGLMGKGIGHGSQSQLNFLPEKHTDFIFSVVSEELGLIGALFILVLYGILLYRLKHTAQNARDNFGYLFTVGVMIMLFIQITVNIGMNIGLLPVTGIPLPLMSYGGSSLVTMFAALGLVLSVFLRKKDTASVSVSPDMALGIYE